MEHVLRIFLVCAGLWLVVVGAVWMLRGYDDSLTQIGLFFTKAAFVTFGGAYAVLSYIADVAVTKGWLAMEQMLIGLGLAESTPGPLIMVTQYVGFLGGWTLSGGIDWFAVGAALLCLVLLQRLRVPIHYFVPIGALAGVIWKMAI